VLIGATALGVGDTFATPFSRDVPGVEVLATGLANILQGDVLVRDWRVRLLDAVALVVIAIVAFSVANARLLPISFALVALIVLTWSAVALLAFLHFGWVLGVVEPVLAAVLVASGVTGARFRAQRIESRRLAGERANLVEYQSPMIAEALASGGALAMEGRSQLTAIMFVDVVGYTLRSERLGPVRTVEFLRTLHRRLERAALDHGGLIEQFMGDGAMLIFGLPEPSSRDAASALACARDLLDSVADWNMALAEEAEPAVRLRIGIHYGPVVVARLGGAQQRHMSVAGDTVNVASRLEQLGRAMMTPILVSGAVIDATRQEGREDLLIGFVPAAPQHIRGRSTPLPVWAYRAPI
jgi:adenylate cyclase